MTSGMALSEKEMYMSKIIPSLLFTAATAAIFLPPAATTIPLAAR
jgi:hypothetical protein